MKIHKLLLLFLTISLFSCSKKDADIIPDHSIVGKWELIKVSDYLGGDNPSRPENCNLLLTFNNDRTFIAEYIPNFKSCQNKNGDYSINVTVLNITTYDDFDNTPLTDEFKVLKLNDKTLIIQPFGYISSGNETVIDIEKRDIFEFVRIN